MSAASIAAAAIEPFTIAVPDAVLDDLRLRLARTRLPAPHPGAPGCAGMDRATMEDLLGSWRDGFDWRREERALNGFPQFRTTLDGARVHFVHRRSPEPDALPLVITHGGRGRSRSCGRSSIRSPIRSRTVDGGRTRSTSSARRSRATGSPIPRPRRTTTSARSAGRSRR